MSLADYEAEQRVIPLKGGSFSVKGLSLADITSLIRTHIPDLEAIFDLGQSVLSGKSELAESDITSLALAMAEQAPGLVANLIALASGSRDEKSVSAAYSLPFPVQVDVLIAIAELTFDEVGGVKKGMESITRLLTMGRTPVIPQPTPETHR